MIKNKIGISVLGIILVGIVGVYANFVFKWNADLNDALTSFGHKISNYFGRMGLLSSSQDYNYVANMNVEMQIPSQGVNAKVSMKGIQMVSLDKMLKYRLGVDSITGEITGGTITGFNINTLDYIVDEEKIFFKLDPEFLKKNYPMASMTGNQLVTSYMKALEMGQYLFMNKADKNLKMLGTLADDEIVKLAVIGLATSNPGYYLEKHDFDKKLRKKLFTKGSYKLLFEETKVDGDKKYLKMKESVCEVFLSMVEGAQSANPAFAMMQKPDINECKSYVQTINSFTDGKLFVQEKGNQESLIYEGMFTLNLTYGDGKVDSSKLQIPGVGMWDYSGDKLDLNITPELLKATGHDLSITSKIDFSGKANGNINIAYKSSLGDTNIVMNIENGDLKDWSAKGKIDFEGDVLDINGQGDSNKGSLDIKVSSSGNQIGQLSLKYDGPSVNFSMSEKNSGLDLAFNATYENHKLSGDAKLSVKNPMLNLVATKKGYITFGEKWYNIKEIDVTGDLDISSMMSESMKGKMSLKYMNDDLDCKIDFSQGTNSATFSLVGKMSSKFIDLKVDGKGMEGGKQIGTLDGTIKYNETKDSGLNKFDGIIDLNLDGNKLFVLKIDGDYKEGGASYTIPNNFVPFDYEQLIYSSMSYPTTNYGTGFDAQSIPNIGTGSFDPSMLSGVQTLPMGE